MSFLQLLKIICEDLIPYYSNQSSNESILKYRPAHAKIKQKSIMLKEDRFHQPIVSDFIYYFGLNSIFKINSETKSCTCRWFMAYASCKHIYR